MATVIDEILKKGISPRLLHVTLIKNLPQIFSSEFLLSRNLVPSGSFGNISNASVQAIRAKKIIPQSNRVLHDYVPFFFSFCAPMMAEIQEHNESLVYIQIPLDIFTRIPGTFIADGNAATSSTKFYDFKNANDLDVLDTSVVWKAIKWSEDPEKKRKKGAEVLIPDKVPISEIRKLSVFSATGFKEVSEILAKSGQKFAISIDQNWFYYRPPQVT